MRRNLLLLALSLGLWGSATQQAMALDKNADGYYQIANLDDFYEFNDIVSFDHETDAKAVLTADIDMTAAGSWVPIGSEEFPYHGTFDGQMHKIKNLHVSGANYVALFGVVNGGAVFKNLIIDASCSFEGGDFVAGVVGGTSGNGGGVVTFENVGNEADVTGTGANAAGIIGVSMLGKCSFVMTNCFNAGNITGDHESAAMTGWGPGSIYTNCYNAGVITGVDGSNSFSRADATFINCYSTQGSQGGKLKEFDAATVATGEFAYKLNGRLSTADVLWRQNLTGDVDPCPVPFSTHGIVYQKGDLNCNGTSKDGSNEYANEATGVRDAHTFVDGFCTVCGEPDPNFMQAVDGVYTIGTPAQLKWFAAKVNVGDNKINGKLSADIDFSAASAQGVMIGHEAAYPFKGVFDGQEHTITLNYNTENDSTALFRNLREATIMNLRTSGTITTTRPLAAGVYVGSWGSLTVKNVISDVKITNTFEGDATSAGIGCFSHDAATLTNVAFIGELEAPNADGNGGIMGYANGGQNVKFINVYVDAKLNTKPSNNQIISRNSSSYKNAFYTDPGTMEADEEAAPIDKSTVASGELAYFLNGKQSGGTDWFQAIGEDNYPVPFASHGKVYASGSESCDGTPKADISYSNTEGSTVRDQHQYDADGVCSVCGARLIKTGAQLKAAADAIANGDAKQNISIDLANDIDMSGVSGYYGIGGREDEGGHPYKGVFDGHGFRVKNLDINEPEKNNMGLISVVGGGVEIRNVILDKSSHITGKSYAGGIVAATAGKGLVTIENCGNEADITVSTENGANAAGILGVDDGSQATIIINNCYNSGTIAGQRENAAISGWLGEHGKVTNSYNTGEVINISYEGNMETGKWETFARGNGREFSNNFDSFGFQGDVQHVEEAQMASGEVAYMLNGKQDGGTVWMQNIDNGETVDARPMLDANHGKVYFAEGKYTNKPVADGISGVTTEANDNVEAIYNVSGIRMNKLQKGVNIVKMSNGKTKKVMVK